MRVKADQRDLATAIETYYIDNKAYPTAATNASGTVAGPNSGLPISPTGAGNINVVIGMRSWPSPLPAHWDYAPVGQLGSIWSFAARGGSQMATLTSPIAYMSSYPPDPFMDTKGATYAYFATVSLVGASGRANAPGWVLWSPGPDTDQATGTNFGINSTSPIHSVPVLGSTVETLYDATQAQPTGSWHYGSNGFGLLYDPTNGVVSRGDVGRFKS